MTKKIKPKDIVAFPTYEYGNKTLNTRNHTEYMLIRTLNMFKYEGLPESLPAVELEKLLQMNGYAILLKHEDDLLAFNGGFSGQDVYGNNTTAIISNPAINLNKEYKIGEDCVLMLNDDLRKGLLPLINRYSYLITESDITMVLANIAKRMQTTISANDDITRESAELYLKRIHDGDIGIIAESKMFDSLKIFNQETNSNSLTELFEYQQYLKGTMYNELGLNANYNMKRERLTAGEVNMNIDSLYPLIYDMFENRRQGVEKINELFGTEISVEFNHIWKQKQNEVELMGVDLEEQERLAQEESDKLNQMVAEISEEIKKLTNDTAELDVDVLFGDNDEIELPASTESGEWVDIKEISPDVLLELFTQEELKNSTIGEIEFLANKHIDELDVDMEEVENDSL